jgi:hypothetical protein
MLWYNKLECSSLSEISTPALYFWALPWVKLQSLVVTLPYLHNLGWGEIFFNSQTRQLILDESLH